MCKPRDNSEAIAAFVGRKTEIDTTLGRLTPLNADHFNCSPDEVNRSDVGPLGSYLERLRQIGDAAFHEGEHVN